MAQRFGVVLLVTTIGLAGCSGPSRTGSSSDPATEAIQAAPGESAAATKAQLGSANRSVIQTASLQLRVIKPADAAQQSIGIISARGGLLASQDAGTARADSTPVLRIPASSFAEDWAQSRDWNRRDQDPSRPTT